MEDKIEIPLSKTKILLLLLGAIGFVVLGIIFIINPDEYASSGSGSRVMLLIIGIIGIVFFGVCMVYIARKLFDNKVGLTISDEGILDNTNSANVGLIEWEDITGISTIQVASTKILMLETDKPDKYIARAKGGIAKRAMKANYKMYGSPLSLISSSLKMKYSELEKLLLSEFEKRKNVH